MKSKQVGAIMLVLSWFTVFGQRSVLATPDQNDYCSRTANFMYEACKKDSGEEYWVAHARCLNLSGNETRQACRDSAEEEREEERDECREQRRARKDVCGLLGEGRYNPDFDPANFVNPADIGTTVTPNPYFPLVVGTQWIYNGGDEVITVEVLNKTKVIEGVTCRVVRDVVTESGVATEITDDWMAQDLEGNVWYCGEISQELELFSGDTPQEAEVVSIDGSWKAGQEGALPGILMLANPQPDMTYREEAALGEAEDVAEVTSITGTESVPAGACTNNCVVTRNFSPIEPDSLTSSETKYYASGIGLILEVSTSGRRTELVTFTAP